MPNIPRGLGPETLAFNSLSGIGQPGTGVLKVDGKEVAAQKMDHAYFSGKTHFLSENIEIKYLRVIFTAFSSAL